MSKSVEYLDRAENCAQLAEEATSTPAKNRYKRMEAGWRALAAEQQWLDGELAPHELAAGRNSKQPPIRAPDANLRREDRRVHTSPAGS
jgi:hypothetical protein